MKYFSVIVSTVLLGFLLLACPVSITVSASEAESETSITFSGWGDEGSTITEQSSTESRAALSTSNKTLLKAGEMFSNRLLFLGIIVVFFLLVVIYKKYKKVESDEA